MTILAIIIFVQFLINIFLIRYIWYIICYGSYINLVKQYLFVEKQDSEDKYMDYVAIWPLKPVMLRFWNCKFRNFIIHQDLYDKVLTYFIKKFEE